MEPVFRRLAHHRRAEGVGDDEAGIRRKNLARHVERGGEKQPIAMQPIIEPLLVGTRSAIDDLISTIHNSPSVPSATRSARRPDVNGNSLTTENPSECRSRVVPRATASAVDDCRPSTGKAAASELMLME